MLFCKPVCHVLMMMCVFSDLMLSVVQSIQVLIVHVHVLYMPLGVCYSISVIDRVRVYFHFALGNKFVNDRKERERDCQLHVHVDMLMYMYM